MIAAQIAHAAGEGSERHPQGVHVVVLSVPSEAELRVVSARLLAQESAQTLVVETDEPYRGQAMAIGCELVRDREPLRRALSSLPLLRTSIHQENRSARARASQKDCPVEAVASPTDRVGVSSVDSPGEAAADRARAARSFGESVCSDHDDPSSGDGLSEVAHRPKTCEVSCLSLEVA